jgi:hypothetical protein
MVDPVPHDYQVLMQRGRYRHLDPDVTTRNSLLPRAKADLHKAVELAPNRPGVHLSSTGGEIRC